MWKRIAAAILCLAVPANVSAGPLKESMERAARELPTAQEAQVERGPSRFWTGIALIAGGGALVVLGATEAFDDDRNDAEAGDPEEMIDDDGDDQDWANTAMTYGGLGAVALGGYILWKGWGSPSPARLTLRPGRVEVRHSLRF